MRRNPAGTSSKSDLIESLLRLGDIARNNAVGEVQVALGKAKLLMEKYGLMQFDGRYQQLVEKLAAFLRGEKVESTREEPKQHGPHAEHRDYERYGGYGSYHQYSQARKAQQKATRKAERAQRTAQRKAERKAKRREAKKAYVHPRPADWVVWLWTLKFTVPRRGAAGRRWEKYYGAKTVAEMMDRGATRGDIKKNIIYGYMTTEVAS